MFQEYGPNPPCPQFVLDWGAAFWHLPAIFVSHPTLLHRRDGSATNKYRGFACPPTGGIKEGFPLSLALCVLLYEGFRSMLSREFLKAQLLVSGRDVAVITRDKNTLCQAPHQIQQLFEALRFHANRS